jgi:hypothetical protein
MSSNSANGYVHFHASMRKHNDKTNKNADHAIQMFTISEVVSIMTFE